MVLNYICAGVYAYVDVRSGPDGCENRSAAISHQLSNLGATVSVMPLPSTLSSHVILMCDSLGLCKVH